jgi:UDP-N-acetylmuramate dehydrogenase
MPISTEQSLLDCNTMALPCRAAGVFTLHDEDDLEPLLEALHGAWRQRPRLILGGGSNVLLLEDFPGLVIRPGNAQIEPLQDDGNTILVRVGAGCDWHELVEWSVQRGLYGIENLALIPGLTGAAPIQNIGAYGVEFSRCCEQVEVCDLDSGKRFALNHNDCEFAYRHSVFKTAHAAGWLVTAVTLRLQQEAQPVLDYPGLIEELQGQHKPSTDSKPIDSARIAAAVARIRQRKLPDPTQLGNCGSFFKNPLIETERLQALLAQHPHMPHWPLHGAQAHSKLSAAWLIEQCGWKGHRRGAAGVHENHALVLVNHGGASGRNIWQLACDIRDSVSQRFGLVLEPEPVIIPKQD